MTKLKIEDLNFILIKTKLPLRSLLNLIEEDRDYNLVLDSISSTLTEDEKYNLCHLSLSLKVKLCIYNYSQNINFDISEKSYITDILSKNYNFIYNNGYSIGRGHKREIRSLLNIIKCGKPTNKIISNITPELTKIGQKNLAYHLPEWIKIIDQSKEILSVNKCK